MTGIKINALTVPSDMGDEVAERFVARSGSVDDADGFEGFELLRPEDERNTWLVVTRWSNDAAFDGWRNSGSVEEAHRTPPEVGEDDEPPRPTGLTAELWNSSVEARSSGQPR